MAGTLETMMNKHTKPPYKRTKYNTIMEGWKEAGICASEV